jgi:hypothetical protein
VLQLSWHNFVGQASIIFLLLESWAWMTGDSSQHVHELAAEGKTQTEIVNCLHLHPNTVRKYLRMPAFAACYCSPHPSVVEPIELIWKHVGNKER